MNKPSMKHAIVNGYRLNPSVSDKLDMILALLEVDECTTTDERGARPIAEELVSLPGQKELYVVGGDGTLNEVVNGILGSRRDTSSIVVGVVPGGTGNDFARALGIVTWKDALSAIKRGESICSDISLLSSERNNYSRFFTNIAGTGLDALTSYLRENMELGTGKLAFAVPGVISYFKNKILSGELYVDGSYTELDKIFMLDVLNSQRAGGGMLFHPGASIDDGYLGLTVLRGNYNQERTLWDFLNLMQKAMRNKEALKLVNDISFYKVREVAFAGRQDEPIMIQLDGEPEQLLYPEFKVEVIPRALRFFRNA